MLRRGVLVHPAGPAGHHRDRVAAGGGGRLAGGDGRRSEGGDPQSGVPRVPGNGDLDSRSGERTGGVRRPPGRGFRGAPPPLPIPSAKRPEGLAPPHPVQRRTGGPALRAGGAVLARLLRRQDRGGGGARRHPRCGGVRPRAPRMARHAARRARLRCKTGEAPGASPGAVAPFSPQRKRPQRDLRPAKGGGRPGARAPQAQGAAADAGAALTLLGSDLTETAAPEGAGRDARSRRGFRRPEGPLGRGADGGGHRARRGGVLDGDVPLPPPFCQRGDRRGPERGSATRTGYRSCTARGSRRPFAWRR